MRYPHWRSHCALRIKKAFVKGTIHRYVGLTSPNAYDLLWKPIWLFLQELRIVGYPWWVLGKIFRDIDVNWLPVHPIGLGTFQRMLKEIRQQTRKHRH